MVRRLSAPALSRPISPPSWNSLSSKPNFPFSTSPAVGLSTSRVSSARCAARTAPGHRSQAAASKSGQTQRRDSGPRFPFDSCDISLPLRGHSGSSHGAPANTDPLGKKIYKFIVGALRMTGETGARQLHREGSGYERVQRDPTFAVSQVLQGQIQTTGRE